VDQREHGSAHSGEVLDLENVEVFQVAPEKLRIMGIGFKEKRGKKLCPAATEKSIMCFVPFQ
jgi:hypothetical protein